MDHDYRERKRQGTPSKASDRESAEEWRAWIDAALACYAAKGGLWGIFVRKGPPPGEPPAPADDLALHTEGAHDLRARFAE